MLKPVIIPAPNGGRPGIFRQVCNTLCHALKVVQAYGVHRVPAKYRGGAMFPRLPSYLGRAALSLLLLPLAGCNHLELLSPKDAIGKQEKNLILIVSGLMLLVVILVMVLTLVFA